MARRSLARTLEPTAVTRLFYLPEEVPTLDECRDYKHRSPACSRLPHCDLCATLRHSQRPHPFSPTHGGGRLVDGCPFLWRPPGGGTPAILCLVEKAASTAYKRLLLKAVGRSSWRRTSPHQQPLPYTTSDAEWARPAVFEKGPARGLRSACACCGASERPPRWSLRVALPCLRWVWRLGGWSMAGAA